MAEIKLIVKSISNIIFLYIEGLSLNEPQLPLNNVGTKGRSLQKENILANLEDHPLIIS